ncbi:proteasome accessory factor PafA2 family protein [Gimesia maris]|uniref:proteasome accessory factor PafA2 family protein n=1 Tax=Gimesia maris TaxID=122 RepID=UPI0032F096EC
MSSPKIRTVIGAEAECLTVIEHPEIHDPTIGIDIFLKEMVKLSPSLNGIDGFFNSYGRTYSDQNHIELATAECSNPFQLIYLLQAQQTQARETAEVMRKAGWKITLSNCNHNGVLQNDAASWGFHGNYLVQEHPSKLTDRILPFLVTRVYAGAGGVLWPSGEFCSGVRLNFMDTVQGGDTVVHRAIHSLARDEPLTSQPEKYGYRYHTVLGDGLRSHFSQLLRFGVTELVLKAVTAFPEKLEALPAPQGKDWSPPFWLQALNRFNILRREKDGLHAAHVAIDVQRVYLKIVDEYLDSLPTIPSWMQQVVTIWESTLDAMARRDYEWLAQRLDPWIKHRLFTTYLSAHHRQWSDLQKDYDLACAIALLNQDYHDFSSSESIFNQLEETNALRHQIGPLIQPGQEEEPFVPDLGTRATARARFIKQHQNQQELIVDWDKVVNSQNQVVLHLDDPCFVEKNPIR